MNQHRYTYKPEPARTGPSLDDILCAIGFIALIVFLSLV